MIDVVPWVMLAFSAVLTVLLYQDHWETGSPLVPLLLCGLAAAWTLVIMTVMVAGYSWLGFYTFTGYYYVYRLVGSWRWRIAGVGVVACLAGVSQGLGLQGTFDPAGRSFSSGPFLST